MGSLNQAKESMREKKDLLKKHDGNLLKKKEQKSYCGSDQNKKDNDGSLFRWKIKIWRQPKGALFRSLAT